MKKALLFWGGWDGHQPDQVAALFAEELRKAGFETQVEHNAPEVLNDLEALKGYSLIVPCGSDTPLTDAQTKNLLEAVKSGVGLGGTHGGMGDHFRGNIDYQWMCGGNFLGHPHVGDYTVCVKDAFHPVTAPLPATFAYNSEQYYMMVDPAIQVLADTEYRYEGRVCTMPVIWVRPWGKGRVFYSALGHVAEEFRKYPEVLAMTLRGFLWAAA